MIKNSSNVGHSMIELNLNWCQKYDENYTSRKYVIRSIKFKEYFFREIKKQNH